MAPRKPASAAATGPDPRRLGCAKGSRARVVAEALKKTKAENKALKTENEKLKTKNEGLIEYYNALEEKMKVLRLELDEAKAVARRATDDATRFLA
uniref:Uncharacterized protein n=1 Tax=Oryza punctata TaxID=4537 RepID=A0A0E0KZK9_ORYPU